MPPQKGKRKRSPDELVPYHYNKATIAERKTAVRDLRNGVSMPAVQAHFPNIHRTTIEGWMKEFPNEDALKIQPGDDVLYRRKLEKYGAINKRVVEYVHQRVSDVGRTGFGMNHLALQLAAAQCRQTLLEENAASTKPSQDVDKLLRAFKYSHGWIQSLLRGYGLHLKHLQGESGSVDPEKARVAMEQFRPQVADVPPALIYNMDETGLFYAQLPNTVFATALESKDLHGCKQMTDKKRLTFIMCVSADGLHKLPPTCIGKAVRPVCFRLLRRGEEVPLPYLQQPHAWQNTATAQQWFDQVFLPAKRERHGMQTAFLIMDNVRSHNINPPQDVKIVFLPENVTSKHQPLDQGIISAFKRRYKSMLLSHYLTIVSEPGNFERLQALVPHQRRGTAGMAYGRPAQVLDCLKLAKEAWGAITPSTIRHCWHEAHCLTSTQEQQLLVPDNDFAALQSTLNTSQAQTEELVRIFLKVVTALSQIPRDRDYDLTAFEEVRAPPPSMSHERLASSLELSCVIEDQEDVRDLIEHSVYEAMKASNTTAKNITDDSDEDDVEDLTEVEEEPAPQVPSAGQAEIPSSVTSIRDILDKARSSLLDQEQMLHKLHASEEVLNASRLLGSFYGTQLLADDSNANKAPPQP